MWLEILVAVVVLHSLVAAVLVVLEKRNPTAALAWLMAVVLLPVVGVVAYWLIGRRRFTQRAAGMDRVAELMEDELPGFAQARPSDARSLERAVTIHPAQRSLMALACRVGEFSVSRGNRAHLLKDAHETYPAMERAIGQAETFVHMEYYIMEPDETGRWFRDLLVDKAREGVEVRLLVDHFGSGRLGPDFWRPLVDAGGRFGFSMKTHLGNLPSLWRINYRNHRKITVVDGVHGFTGGINIGDNYLGKGLPEGYWRDMHLELEGAAASDLQRVFARDWMYATGELLKDRRYYPTPPEPGRALAQIIASGPDRRWHPIHKLYFEAIATAQERVYVTSPYFVPDETITLALTTAALSGVDVRLLLPGRSDLPLVRLAGRSYYEELLQAGVRIFEYQRGILHAKTLCVDGRYGTIGSANMDIRSFLLNFEVNAFIYDETFAGELERVFLEDLEHAVELRAEEMGARPVWKKLPERTARLLSGLL